MALQPVFSTPQCKLYTCGEWRKNKAVLTYHAAFEQDGEYMLEVKGRG